MRARAAALTLALLAPGGLAPAGPLGETLPAGVPDGRNLRWERVSGDVLTTDDGALYEFYVNPQRQAIYEVVRYRFSRNGREQTEKVIWNAPAVETGPACYSREADGSWRTLRPGSVEYRDEMMTAMRVYGLHRQVILKRQEAEAR
jgi:hypothetical protein